MTREDDFIGQLEGYLEQHEGMTPLPPAVRDAVRAQLPRTRQIGPLWGPMRYIHMSANLKLGLAAVAVVAAVIIGVAVVLPRMNVGNPTPTVTPSPAPLPAAGVLDPGTYFMRPAVTPIRFTFTVPAGWAIDQDAFVSKHRGEPGEIAFTSWEITHVFTNGCQTAGAVVEVGPTVDDLANALASQVGRATVGPSDVTLGGYAGKRVELSVPADFDMSACDSEAIRDWAGAGGDTGGGWRSFPGQTDVLYILDVEGKRLVINRWDFPGTTPEADITELEGIIASIHFEP